MMPYWASGRTALSQYKNRVEDAEERGIAAKSSRPGAQKRELSLLLYTQFAERIRDMILIIDDDNIVRSSLLFMLKRAGYEAKAVTGPREAMEVVRELITTGHVKRPGIGISVVEIDQTTAEMYQVPQGILVYTVTEDGPAHVADLRINDVILSYDGITAGATTDFVAYVGCCFKKYAFE